MGRVLFFGMLATLILSHATEGIAGDIDSLLDEYRAAERQIQERPRTRDEMVPFWESWLARMVQMNDRHLTSKISARRELLLTALGLSNSLADFEKSEQIARDLLAVETNDALKWRWQAEIGAVLKKQFQRSKSAQSLKDSIQAYEKSLDLARPVAFGETQDSYAQEYFVLNLSSLASLYATEESGVARAAELYRKARRLVSDGTVPVDGMLKHHDTEYFAAKEFESWVRVNNEERAVEAMGSLSGLASPRHPVSWYFRSMIANQHQFTRDSQEYRDVISRWYDRIPDDAEKPVVLYELAMSYSRTGEDRKATEAFERLRSNHREELIAFDAERIQSPFQSADGVYPLVLLKLLMSYRRERRYDDASSVAREFLELYPASSASANVRADLDRMQSRQTSMRELTQPHLGQDSILTRTLIVLNVLAVLTVVLFFAYRRFIKGHKG